MNYFYNDMRVEEDMNAIRDAADVCEDAANTIAKNRISEGRRIALASECVKTFNQILAGLPRGNPIPERVSSSFERYVALLQTFRTERKLTSEQLDLLREAEILAAQLGLV